MRLHPLLAEQVATHLPKEIMNLPAVERFLDAIDSTYHEFQSDLVLLEQHMTQNAEELRALNHQLKQESETHQLVLSRLNQSLKARNLTLDDGERNDQNLLAVAQFVSEQIENQRKIEDNLRAAKESAEAAAKAKTDFLATMSHEIRTPLNGVIGMVALLENTQLNTQQNRYLETIQSCCHSLINLINDILDFSKFDAGKIALERIPFNLHFAVEQTVRVFAERAQAKQIELVAMVDPALPDQLVGDPGRIQQVLLNLLSNAVKFTEKGEVFVHARALRTQTHNRFRTWVELRVRDTGIGISRTSQKRLFQPFTQADSTTTRKFGGTGLGLALCKQIVDAMEGTLSVASKVGIGSEFIIQIPFGIATNQDPAPWRNKTFDKKRILIVDNNRTAADVMHKRLEQWGLTAYVAAKSENARRLLQKGQFDLLILDLHLADGGGLELLRSLLNAEPKLRTIPVLLMTHLVDSPNTASLPPCDLTFITKPIEMQELYDCVACLFESPTAPPTSAPQFTPRQEWLPARTLRVLVAEDDHVNQEIATMMLRDLNCRVDIAENGLEAVAAVERIQYDALFMDCQMPEMDGYQATRLIRSNGHHELPIIALTANAMPEDRQVCITAGMSDYITKPVKPATLAQVLQKWTHSRSSLDTPETPAPTGTADNAPEEPITTELTDAPECLNVSHGLEMMGGKVGRYVKLLKLALQQHHDTPTGIRMALEEGRHEVALKLAHSLKSVTANIGADLASGMTFELEKRLKENTFGGVRLAPLAQELEQHWRLVKESAQTFIDQHGTH